MAMLSQFMVVEIGSKGMQGITYALLKNDGKDDDRIQDYLQIKDECEKCGYTNNEIFRTFALCNGYIFDMDINTVKQITREMTSALIKQGLMQERDIDLIKDDPDKRRRRDMYNLAQFIRDRYNKGIYEFEVALFSRNLSNQIRLTLKDSKNNYKVLIFRSYVLRHWDIEEVNAKFLMPAGIRVSSIQPMEILPNKNGVAFKFVIEGIRPYEIEHSGY